MKSLQSNGSTMISIKLLIILLIGCEAISCLPFHNFTLIQRNIHKRDLDYACELTSINVQVPIESGDTERCDIRDGLIGTPFHLIIRLINSRTCSPLQGAFVHISHANALGQYSGFERDITTGFNGMFLRGYQKTDGNGDVEFKTIIPGWVIGKSLHINIVVTLEATNFDSIIFIGQLLFDETLPDHQNLTTFLRSVYPYSENSNGIIKNLKDPLDKYQGSSMILSLTKIGAGFQSITSLGVDPTTN